MDTKNQAMPVPREGFGNTKDASSASKGFAISLGRQPHRRHWKAQALGLSDLQETMEAWWLREALADHSGQGKNTGGKSQTW